MNEPTWVNDFFKQPIKPIFSNDKNKKQENDEDKTFDDGFNGGLTTDI